MSVDELVDDEEQSIQSAEDDFASSGIPSSDDEDSSGEESCSEVEKRELLDSTQVIVEKPESGCNNEQLNVKWCRLRFAHQEEGNQYISNIKKRKRQNTKGACTVCPKNDVMSINYFYCNCHDNCPARYKKLVCRSSRLIQIYSNMPEHNLLSNLTKKSSAFTNEIKEKVKMLSNFGPIAIRMRLREELGNKVELPSRTELKNFLYTYRRIKGNSNNYSDLIKVLGNVFIYYRKNDIL